MINTCYRLTAFRGPSLFPEGFKAAFSGRSFPWQIPPGQRLRVVDHPPTKPGEFELPGGRAIAAGLFKRQVRVRRGLRR